MMQSDNGPMPRKGEEMKIWICADNGQCACTDHLDRFGVRKGRGGYADSRGGRPLFVSPEVLRESLSMGFEPKCEICGVRASLVVQP